MAENKTRQTDASVAAFVARQPKNVQDDCAVLIAKMRAASGKPPKLWGPSIIGFGAMIYRYDTGRTGDWPYIGFSPRKTNLTLYISGGEWNPALLKQLGKHSTGRACLYIKRLSDVDERVLDALIADAMKAALAYEAKMNAGASLPSKTGETVKAKKRAAAAGAKPAAKRVSVSNVNVPGSKVNLEAVKYEAMKKTLLKVLPRKAPGVTQAEMMALVNQHAPQDLWPGGAKAGWWMKAVQLDLEARGVVVREPSKPLRWHRA